MDSANKRKVLIIFIVALVLILTVLLIVIKPDRRQAPQETTCVTTTEPATEAVTEPVTEPATEPTQPPVIKEATATIGATGDILMHTPVIESGFYSSTGTYDFNEMFDHFREIVSTVDFAAANLEVTLCGEDYGIPYQGYPLFNSPDAIVDALKNAGFDMLLTANNHAYDTGAEGFVRTQQVVEDAGLVHIGSRTSEEVRPYYIADINGIRIGMINYTYDTRTYTGGRISLNGLPLADEHVPLMNTFNYKYLDRFYEELQGRMDAMYADGAEAVVLYIHWGIEYEITENATQREMARQLCDMGVDVIVGNHAHVPQPVELLTSREDENQKTLCLYSTGNALSNIYKTKQFPANTEDGMLFTFTFARYSDGTVLLEDVRVIPTWVYRYAENYRHKYMILYMDDRAESWQRLEELEEFVQQSCRASYDRTMAIVGAGVTEANAWFDENQRIVEENLGVS